MNSLTLKLLYNKMVGNSVNHKRSFYRKFNFESSHGHEKSCYLKVNFQVFNRKNGESCGKVMEFHFLGPNISCYLKTGSILLVIEQKNFEEPNLSIK